MYQFLLFISALVAIAVEAGEPAPFGWTYAGPLGQTSWWAKGFSDCDSSNAPQSPINVVTASRTATTRNIVVRGTVTPATRAMSAVIHPETTNMLRADLWPSQVIVDILFDGESATDLTKYVLHHISVHIPAQHQIDSVTSTGEFDFVFFPHRVNVSTATYKAGGVNLVMPFVSSTSATSSRFDEMLKGFTNAYTTGVARFPFTLPAFGDSALYNGTLTYPPCSTQMRTVVNIQPLAMQTSIVQFLVAREPSAQTARSVQPLGARVVERAAVTYNNVFLTFDNAATMATRAGTYSLQVNPLDVKALAYGYGALTAGMICVILLVCIAVSVFERFSFISSVKDTWGNSVADQSGFGCAQDDDNEQIEEQDEEEEDEEEEEED